LLLGDQVELYFLTLLRSLSGRLALKLLSAPNQVSEVLGLAMARLFLEQYDLLKNRILIPLDAHSNLFTESGRTITAVDEVSFQRSDLLLVSCDIENRKLAFHIIEVKWRTDLGDLNAYLTLKQQVESQLGQSENTLREHFDPNFLSVDRLDRAVKVRELVSLLNFYLERSLRYGLIDQESAEAIRPFIESLDQGFSIETSKIGLIFDFGSIGLTPDEEYSALVFYRIGKDYINRLLETGLRLYTRLQTPIDKAGSIVEQQQQQEEQERIKRETGMSTDINYPVVQTHFRPPSRVPSPETKKLVEEPAEEKEKPETLGPPKKSTPSNIEPGMQVAQPTKREDIETTAPEEPTEKAVMIETDETPKGITSNNFDPPPYDVLIGDTSRTKQYGILGKSSGQILALDLNGTNTISLFGVQGGGKSYTVGSVVEMATQAIEGINALPSPLASVIFHYHESQDYPPEFVSMNKPNSNEDEIKALKQEYGAAPARLGDVLILTSADKLPLRKVEFPSVQVEPIYFSSTELSIKDWRFLMGVAGNQMYMKQINMIMRQLREKMTLQTLREQIRESDLSDSQKNIAGIRLDFASQFINDRVSLAEKLQPGRLIIVDLRDEFIDKEEALGLFVVMLNIFANAGHDKGFNKLIVFDEAHKYMDNPDLTSHIVDVIRQMRHQGVSVLIASQDPPSLPNAIIELSTLIILHRFNSPQWLRHVQRSITALADLTPAQMASLGPGEAFIWATKATERIFNQKAIRVRMRPRATQHGGGTKTAV
jgi:DNA phosphorothioation-dependent restriction protein DptH